MSEITTQRFQGTVVSVGDKVATVLVVTYKTHEKYRKKYRISKKYRVHVDGEVPAVGDAVSFMPCKPESKGKRFRMV